VVVQGGNVNAIRQQIEAKLKERQDVDAAETKTAAEKTLTPAQLTRLVEIDLQVRGVEAFTDPKVADALRLTDEQKKAVEEVIESAKNAVNQPVFPPGVAGGVVGRPVLAGLTDPKARKATYEKAAETLTKEQLATWKKMTGEAVSGFDPHAILTAGGSITVRGGIMAAPAMPVVPGVPLVPPAAPPPKKDD
jgi:hypothetical protein